MPEFKFKTQNSEIMEALIESSARINDAAISLEKVVELITENELWRIIRQDVRDVRDEVLQLGQKLAGLVDFIEQESTGS